MLWNFFGTVCGGSGWIRRVFVLLAVGGLTGISFSQVTIEPTSIELDLAPGEEYVETKIVSIPGFTPANPVDIYVLADTTGSMGNVIDEVRENAEEILTLLTGMLGDVRFGIGQYKDFPNEDFCFSHDAGITDDFPTLLAAINALAHGGGGDGAEGQFFALDQIADPADPYGIGFRPDAQKIIVWFGDAPAHDPVCAAMSGLDYDITQAGVIDKLVADGFAVIAIGTTTGYDEALNDDPNRYWRDYRDYEDVCVIEGEPGQADAIAAATGGVSMQDVEPEQIANTIVNAVGQVFLSVDCALEPAGQIVPMTEVLTPPYVDAVLPPEGEFLELEFQVKFTGAPCDPDLNEHVFVGTVDAVVDGAVAAQQDVTIRQPRCDNEQPVCDAGGPYVAECVGEGAGPVTIQLDGTGSFDPNSDDPLTYWWSSDCPEAEIADPTAVSPVLSLASGCDVQCSVTLTVTDIFDETATCEATVQVNDTMPPTFVVAPDDLLIECGADGIAAQIDGWLESAAAEDVCGDVTLTHDYVGLSDGCGDSGDATVTWTATDACGLTATHTATVSVIDSTPPTFTTAPSDATFECDGTGNVDDIEDWLSGAGATDACGDAVVTHDFTGLEGECGGTGAALVTFTATDSCGLTATHAATLEVVDTTPPEIACPDDIEIECSEPVAPEYVGWASAADVCDPNPTLTYEDDIEVEPCWWEGVVTRTWIATDACGNESTCAQTITVIDPRIPRAAGGSRLIGAGSLPAVIQYNFPEPPPEQPMEQGRDGLRNRDPVHAPPPNLPGPLERVSPSRKGSLLVYPKVEVRWDQAGNLIQDTFITINNDWGADVQLQMYFVSETCNDVDNVISLTANEPAHWSVATGLPKGVSPWTVLGDPYPDPEGSGELIMRGYVLAWAIDSGSYAQIRWNHLSGAATIVQYYDRDAWEYDAYAFRAVTGAHGEPVGTAGTLQLDDTEYESGYEMLLLDFFASGSDAFSHGAHHVTHDTDLTLLIVNNDLRLDSLGPNTTKARFEIFNENELLFSGMEFCMTKWDEMLLSLRGGHFHVAALQTDKGRARIRGVESEVCPDSTQQSLLGVAAKLLVFE